MSLLARHVAFRSNLSVVAVVSRAGAADFSCATAVDTSASAAIDEAASSLLIFMSVLLL
jgi:uncharacterized metal-binding protein